ncbi:carbohydrate ABC transporter permease [Streptomyces sp. WMMB 322]|uniref:carbohydrate ABC transporter permease n=1 Tax=Streptomyces sp. WMMB 322 TaxID=1286821 RepID=UPI0006E45C98|nr:carbohydrate ABC transporter permease [Streptomyces sp. WMMB 322]SCK18666.1 carbohydrate ABC transporter membrane protein 2, CUT1 family (TC 3.A.1.1.-) [Streptomyces sp. WMMB 322]
MTLQHSEAEATRSAAGPPTTDGPGPPRRRPRVALHVACVVVSLAMTAPLYLITLAAFSTPETLDAFPLSLLPTDLSTTTMEAFLNSTGVVAGLTNSLQVGLASLVLSLVLGVPAGYALARYAFRGRDAYQLFMLLTRALPIVVLSVPLAQMFLNTGLYDSTYAVTLLHTALALPTTVLITTSVFVAVPRDHEEAATVFGASPLAAFSRVVLPQALPGIAAAALFTFVTSWNEVLGASILTLDRRTLPAQVLSALNNSPLTYRYAGGFALVIPALLFIALMRRYLLNMWGTTLR